MEEKTGVASFGRIPHKDLVHEGSQAAIVDQALFDKVQQRLGAQARRHRAAGEQRTVRAALTGRLFDAMDEPMTPSFSRGRSGRLYRYYVSASLQQGVRRTDNQVMRLSAVAFEKLVTDVLMRWVPNASSPLDLPIAIRLREQERLLDLPGNLAADISGWLQDGERLLHSTKQVCRIDIALSLPLRGGSKTISFGLRTSRPDRSLINALRKAHGMLEYHRGLPNLDAAPVSRYNRDTLALAFLARDIQRDILAGRQPKTLSLENLRHIDIPLSWRRQRELLGWASAG